DTDSHQLTQQDRPMRRAAEVNAGVDAMAGRDIERELGEFTVKVKAVTISSGIRIERKAVRARCNDVTSRRKQKRADMLRPVKEELQGRAACPGNRSVTGRITRVRRRTFREGLRQQISAVIRERLRQSGR